MYNISQYLFLIICYIAVLCAKSSYLLQKYIIFIIYATPEAKDFTENNVLHLPQYHSRAAAHTTSCRYHHSPCSSSLSCKLGRDSQD